MDPDRIQSLAITEATTGLRGADLYAFEAWWPEASDQEQAMFRETVDLITMITLAQMPEVTPPAHLKDKLMDSLKERPKQATSTTVGEAVPGYTFMLDSGGEWRELPVNGARIKELSCSKENGTAVFILEMDPGARLPSHDHRGMEEAFVLHGDLQMRGQVLRAGDYMRAEPGTKHQDLYSEEGCRALLITSLDNYPRRAIRAFDGLHKAWSKCKGVFASTAKD